MPVKAVSAAARKANRDTMDFCEIHGEGCQKHRYPDPEIWGHRDTDGRGRQTSRWIMTPEQSLDAELSFRAHFLRMLRGVSEDQFLAQPCKIVQMPRAEYRRKFGRRSTDVDEGLAERIRLGRAEQARQFVPDTFRRTTPAELHESVPAFEEEE